MQRKPFILALIVSLAILFGIAGCDTQNEASDSRTGYNTSSGKMVISEKSLETILSQQDLTIRKSISIDGHTGYLAEYTSLIKNPQKPKYCLILTGTPYAMGYQAACLRSAEAHAMLTTFIKRVGIAQLEMFGIKLEEGDPVAEKLWKWMYKTVLGYAKDAEPRVPEYQKEEMRGLAAGMLASGYTDVSYWDVMILNQGVDTAYYLLGALFGEIPDSDRSAETVEGLKAVVESEPSLEGTVIFDGNRALFPYADKNAKLLRGGCNEFVINNHATADGGTLHGRDFMFNTGVVYQDCCCVMLYLPSDPDAKPFVTIDPAGFVGHTTGINSDGVSIGQDVSLSNAFGYTVDMGCLMVVRHVLQYASSLRHAVNLLTGCPRGVPWDYIIADDDDDSEYGPGVVLETLPSDPYYNGYNMLPKWEQTKLAWFINNLTDEEPERGVGIRHARWIFPEEYKHTSIELPVSNPFFPDMERWNIGVYFPDQIETYRDVVVATNHFIMPRMHLSQMHPIVAALYELGNLPESVWRYEHMITDIQSLYGTIGFFGPDPENPAPGTGGWIINFLDISRCDFWKEVNNRVEGHRDIISNNDREIRSIFGYMGDPWVGLKLKPFLDARTKVE